MANYGQETTTTNKEKNTKKTVNYDCPTMWSMVQEKAYMRLSDQTSETELTLIENYAVRARRIAATYARFYLEQEEKCDPDKKGRFYWMALGAFASKTVACTLELFWVKRQDNFLTETTFEGLGKGNFWLFQDIAGWHWYYTQYNGTFDMCAPTRNANDCAPEVKKCLNTLPWASDALPKVKQMQITPEIRSGFAKVKQIEGMSKSSLARPTKQLKHLEDIANHEQLKILQPLIYDDPEFAKWLDRSRWPVVNWFAPELSLAFTSACETDDPKLKSVAPEDTVMEDEDSRMFWINLAAKKFHGLMQTQTTYMEAELQKIAGWYNLPDQFHTHKLPSRIVRGAVKNTKNGIDKAIDVITGQKE